MMFVSLNSTFNSLLLAEKCIFVTYYITFAKFITCNYMKIKKLYKEFIQSEKAGGLVLVFATVLSLVVANSGWQTAYTHFWHIDMGGHSLVYWINDGLMTIFFLLIGLELEREIYQGELSDIKGALLPIFGALGGMLILSLIHISE